MPLITPSYFVGDIAIANVSKPDIREVLLYFIEQYEQKFLQLILGLELYAALKDEYITIPQNAVPTARMTALVQGTTFTSNGKLLQWDGLLQKRAITSSIDLNKSMIANYIYYWYVRNNTTQTSGVGEVQNTVENARNVRSDLKLARAYNSIIPQIQMLLRFLNEKAADYPEWEQGKWFVYQNADLWSPINPVF